MNKPPARMWEAVAEILKYAVKSSDMIRDHEWFSPYPISSRRREVWPSWHPEALHQGTGAGAADEEPGEETPALSAEQLFLGGSVSQEYRSSMRSEFISHFSSAQNVPLAISRSMSDGELWRPR